MATPPGANRDPLLVWLRDSFAAGVAVVLPFAVTAWLLWQFVRFVDSVVLRPLPEGVRDQWAWLPGFGLIVAVAALIVTGALTKGLLGRLAVRGSEALVQQLPVVRSIYGGAKQIFKQVAAPERTSFKEAVLVPFPMEGCWTIGFITNEATQEVTASAPEPLIAVYVPQAPIPTTGFLIYFPRSAMRPIALGPEEALKRVFSLGMIKDGEEAPEAAPVDRPPVN